MNVLIFQIWGDQRCIQDCQLPMVNVFEKISLKDVCQDPQYATAKHFFLDVWTTSAILLSASANRTLINNGSNSQKSFL